MEKIDKFRIIKEKVKCIFTSKMGMLKSTKSIIIDLEKKQEKFDQECWNVQKARNNLEEYVLEAQIEYNQGGIYYEYMSNEESESFIASIYMDEYLSTDDFNKSSSEYLEKLNNLKMISSIYKNRYDEFQKRVEALKLMEKLLCEIDIFIKKECKQESEYIEKNIIVDFISKYEKNNIYFKEKFKLHVNTPKMNSIPYPSIDIIIKMRELNTIFLEIKNIPKTEKLKNTKSNEVSKNESKKSEKNIEIKNIDKQN